MPRAASLAAELKDRLGWDAELLPGEKGAFEVEYQKQLLFSKKSLGRFPEEGEILSLIQKAQESSS